MSKLTGIARTGAAALVLLLAACLGCGGGKNDADPSLVPVSGTVTFNGQPLATGIVTLVGDGATAGSPASGKIESGKFTIMTSVSAPGARPGNYKVVIVAKDGVDTMDATGKPVVAKNLIPDRYADVATSGLTATIEKGGSQLKFELVP